MYVTLKLSSYYKQKPPLRTGYQPTTGADACSEDTRHKQAYCIIRSSQTQAEHPFPAGCYFYTQNPLDFDGFRRKDDTYED